MSCVSTHCLPLLGYSHSYSCIITERKKYMLYCVTYCLDRVKATLNLPKHVMLHRLCSEGKVWVKFFCICMSGLVCVSVCGLRRLQLQNGSQSVSLLYTVKGHLFQLSLSIWFTICIVQSYVGLPHTGSTAAEQMTEVHLVNRFPLAANVLWCKTLILLTFTFKLVQV